MLFIQRISSKIQTIHLTTLPCCKQGYFSSSNGDDSCGSCGLIAVVVVVAELVLPKLQQGYVPRK